MLLPIIEKKGKVMEPFAFALEKFLVCTLAREMLDEFDLRGARIRQGKSEIMLGRPTTNATCSRLLPRYDSGELASIGFSPPALTLRHRLYFLSHHTSTREVRERLRRTLPNGALTLSSPLLQLLSLRTRSLSRHLRTELMDVLWTSDPAARFGVESPSSPRVRLSIQVDG